MPEFLGRRFSPTARWVLSVITLAAHVLTKFAVVIFAGGVVFATLLPDVAVRVGGATFNSFWIGTVAVVLLTGLYTVLGGMRAVAYTDALQTFILLVGSGLLTVFGLAKLGGWHELRRVLDPDLFNLWKPIVPAGMEGSWAPVKETGRIAWYFNGNYPWPGMLLCAPIIGLWYCCTDQCVVHALHDGPVPEVPAECATASPGMGGARRHRRDGRDQPAVDSRDPGRARAVRLSPGRAGLPRPSHLHRVRVRHLQPAAQLQGVPRRVDRGLCARRLPPGRGHAGELASGGIRRRVCTRLVPVDHQQSLLPVLQRVHFRRLGRRDVRGELRDGAAGPRAAGGADLRDGRRRGSHPVPQQLEPSGRYRLGGGAAPDSRGVPVFPGLTCTEPSRPSSRWSS